MAMNVERLPRTIITVGASAGGVDAMTELFSRLPLDLPAAVLAVIHRSPTHVGELARVLGRRAVMPVADAVDGEAVKPGRICIAPAGAHLLVESGRLRLSRGPKIHFTRPAVDPLFTSAATASGPRVVGVLLSGRGDDGVSGLIAITRAGGLSVAQHPGEAASSSMPTNAILFDHVDAVLPLDRIAKVLMILAAGDVVDDHDIEGAAPTRRMAPLAWEDTRV